MIGSGLLHQHMYRTCHPNKFVFVSEKMYHSPSMCSKQTKMTSSWACLKNEECIKGRLMIVLVIR